MKKKNNYAIFSVLKNELKKKTFVDLDKFLAKYNITLKELQSLAKENSENAEMLQMAICRVLNNAERLALQGKMSYEKLAQIYSKYDPEKNAKFKQFFENEVENG